MTDKDSVIYLETDEDITSAIDKMNQTSGGSLQIVTPKRSTLFQSLINQKLIKKAADDAGKELIIVTNDRVVTNLAARVGIPVAAQIGGQPHVPEAPSRPEMPSDEIESSIEDKPSSMDEDSEADEEPVAPPIITRTPVMPTPTPPAQGGPVPKHKAVPNFGLMQKRLLWAGLGLSIVAGLIALNFLLTSAKVTLFAKATRVDSSVRFIADPTAQQSSPDQGILAAEQLELTKTLTATAPATGQKDVGTKAEGEMTVTNCSTNQQTLVAGTRFASADNKIFRSKSDITVPSATFPIGVCVPGKAAVNVTADANGDSYNLAPANYTIPALNNPAVTAKGNQMSGGTSKIAQVVTQEDIEKARAEALEKDKEDARKELSAKGKSKKIIDISFEQKAARTTASPEAGQEASQVKISIDVTYTQLAVAKTDFSDMVRAQEQKQLGDQKEIYEDGSDTAKFSKGKGSNEFVAGLVAYAGAKIDKSALAKEMKGKKYGDAADIAARSAGIDKADIKLTPSWATSMPWLADRIYVEVKVNDIK